MPKTDLSNSIGGLPHTNAQFRYELFDADTEVTVNMWTNVADVDSEVTYTWDAVTIAFKF